MTSGIPPVIDPELLLAIGVVCLTAAAAVYVALVAEALTKAEWVGVASGTLLTACIYILITQFQLPLVWFTTPAIMVSAAVIAGASLISLVRLSRAEL